MGREGTEAGIATREAGFLAEARFLAAGFFLTAFLLAGFRAGFFFAVLRPAPFAAALDIFFLATTFFFFPAFFFAAFFFALAM